MKPEPSGLTIEGRAFLVACVGILVMALGVLVMTGLQSNAARALIDALMAAMIATATAWALASAR